MRKSHPTLVPFLYVLRYKYLLTFGNRRGSRATPLLLRLIAHSDFPADVFVRLKDDDVHLWRV